MTGQVQEENIEQLSKEKSKENTESNGNLQGDIDSYSFKKEDEDMKKMEDQQLKIIDDLLRSIKLEDLIFKFMKSCNHYITTRSMRNKNLELKLQQS